MSKFSVKIVECPAVKTAGLKIKTTMEKASVDCPKLWSEDFVPYMEKFPCDGAGVSYGISIMTGETDFDYWAVMPLGKGAKVPAGLSEITISGGLYLECPIKSLAEIGAAYQYLYMEWGAERKDYAVNMQGASLEVYTEEYMKNGSLTLRIPLIKK